MEAAPTTAPPAVPASRPASRVNPSAVLAVVAFWTSPALVDALI